LVFLASMLNVQHFNCRVVWCGDQVGKFTWCVIGHLDNANSTALYVGVVRQTQCIMVHTKDMQFENLGPKEEL